MLSLSRAGRRDSGLIPWPHAASRSIRVAVAQANGCRSTLDFRPSGGAGDPVYIQYTTPALAGPQVAVLYTFWLKSGKGWTAVWLGDEYAAYKAGKCYVTAQGQAPLY
jgi:hypothetical protein